MKRALSFFLVLMLIVCLVPMQAAAAPAAKTTPAPAAAKKEAEPDPAEYYIIGDSENTFAGLYDRMCKSLDLKEHPLPEADTDGGTYGTKDYEYVYVLKDDDTSYEYIGKVFNKSGKELYLVWYWAGYHEDGSIIGMKTYYTLKGQYLGNIQRDISAGTSTSSHRSPYFIKGEPINKK
ncbi:MAG: hypothetical protein K6F56_01950 [Oscillospiraceae bacterium]|nr:hypothetical protein [Oscillospiraceae bacterium]